MSASDDRIETRVIHAGVGQRIDGAVVTPVFQSVTYAMQDHAAYHDIRYLRLNNSPNHLVLHRKLAALEGGAAALVTASGMAAISTTLFTVLGGGGHLLAQRCLYGGTMDLLTREFKNFGLDYTLIDATDPAGWRAALQPNTRAIYVESLTNPTLEVADFEAVVAFAREHGLVSLIDSTFASPVNFRPIEHGFDLVLHSCTKYLNGHSDIIAGAVIGTVERVEAIRRQLNLLGGSLDPHACFLLERGMKTLALRVRQQNASALAVARMLEAHPAVVQVHYPGLQGHPGHGRASRLFDGFGGMIAFELHGGRAAAERCIARLRLPLHAVSLGGVESLITLPSLASHAGLTAQERAAAGITDGMLRLSIGIEAADDLLADLQQALA